MPGSARRLKPRLPAAHEEHGVATRKDSGVSARCPVRNGYEGRERFSFSNWFSASGFLLADLKSPWAVLAVWVGGGIIATLGALKLRGAGAAVAAIGRGIPVPLAHAASLGGLGEGENVRDAMGCEFTVPPMPGKKLSCALNTRIS